VLKETVPQHWDWFDEDELVKMNMTDGNRVATVLMYLSGTAEMCRSLAHLFPAHLAALLRQLNEAVI
jgi:hypothetical protein